MIEITSTELRRNMIAIYESWLKTYPILSIEDGLAEHDWAGWQLMTQKLGSALQLVGDDIFVTNPKIFKKGIAEKIGNAIAVRRVASKAFRSWMPFMEFVKMQSRAGE